MKRRKDYLLKKWMVLFFYLLYISIIFKENLLLINF
jgi:hypothetical protein